MTENRVSIIGCEQTFAPLKAVIFTERQPSATSLVLVTKFAPFELRSAGDDFHSGLFPLRHGSAGQLHGAHSMFAAMLVTRFMFPSPFFCCVFNVSLNTYLLPVKLGCLQEAKALFIKSD